MNIRKILAVSLIVVVGVFMLSTANVLAGDREGLPCYGDFTNDGDVDATDMTAFLFHYGRGQYDDPCPFEPPSKLPKTGQTNSYGVPTSDGALEKGVEPPGPRFISNADGSVTDLLHGLVWSPLLNCPGESNWTGAINWCKSTPAELPECGMDGSIYSSGDFRLPNIRELMSLIDYGQNNPALPLGHLFMFDPGGSRPFWTSTTQDVVSTNAWIVYLTSGRPFYFSKTADTAYVLCVADMKPTIIIPQPRFTINGDGTVTDNDTGLVWLEDAGCIGPQNWDDAMSTAALLDSDTDPCGLTDGSQAGDWRLPTKEEWEEFVCTQYTNPAVCNTEGIGQWAEGDPFMNVYYIIVANYWSSTEYGSPDAWQMYLRDGSMSHLPKHLAYYVWPVRDP
jgi:hypothetical protein